MARLYYYVLSAGSQWEVRFDGQAKDKRYLYDTQEKAIEVARDTAKKHWDEKKKPAGVRIQRVGGQWRDEWSYGEDPYPPPG